MSVSDEAPTTGAVAKSGLGLRAPGRDKYSADVTAIQSAPTQREFFDPKTKILTNGPYVGELPVVNGLWSDDDACIPDVAPKDDPKDDDDLDKVRAADSKGYDSDDDSKDSESKLTRRFSKRDADSDDDKSSRRHK
jgi:hypothetical protein